MILLKFWWLICIGIIYVIYAMCAIADTADSIRYHKDMEISTILFYLVTAVGSAVASFIYFITTI